jgi:hypothetical protein
MEDPHGELLPGMTRLGVEPAANITPLADIKSVPAAGNRKVILLATANITEDNIFTNGLFQNVILLYRMFEAMAWTPINCKYEAC